MKLQELKQEILKTWETVYQISGTLPTTEFKAEIRKYGDLRKKQTWINALASLTVTTLMHSGMDGRGVLQLFFCHPCDRVLAEYNDAILDAFLASPDGLAAVKYGLEMLYYQPTQPGDRQDALDFLKRISGYQELGLELPTLSLTSG